MPHIRHRPAGRLLAVVTAATLLAVALTGCSRSDGSVGNDVPTPPPSTSSP